MTTIYNNTSNPIIHKVWILDVVKVKTNHLTFLKSNDIVARFVQPETKTIDVGFRTVQYAAQLGVAEFETVNEKQETSLKLLYGADLILRSMNVILPNSAIVLNDQYY